MLGDDSPTVITAIRSVPGVCRVGDDRVASRSRPQSVGSPPQEESSTTE